MSNFRQMESKLFFLMIISLPFCNLPPYLNFNYDLFNIGQMGNKLIAYPFWGGLCILLCVYFCYALNLIKHNMNCNYSESKDTFEISVFSKYVLVCLLVGELSLLWGVLHYPYYAEAFSSSPESYSKAIILFSWMQSHSMHIDMTILLKFWTFVRFSKMLILSLITTFGCSFLIFYWVRNNAKIYYQTLCNGVTITVGIILLYSTIEIPFLLGNEYCKNILMLITPYIHEVYTDTGISSWWPPLLWEGQLRSVFAEPSYFGIYFSFATPFLWYRCLTSSKAAISVFYFIILYVYTFCLFLSNARTGMVLLIIESVFLFLYLLYMLIQSKNYYIWGFRGFMILAITFMAFFTNTELFVPQIDVNFTGIYAEDDSAGYEEKYISQTIGSLDSLQKRSNASRYTVMKADFETGMTHPILGVGYRLRSGYIAEKLEQQYYKNNEIEEWISSIHKLGPLQYDITPMSEYLIRFSETGISGLLIFLLSSLYLFIRILCLLKNKEPQDFFFLLSFIGILCSGFISIINITWCYWILLGFGYAWINKAHS